MKKDLFIFRHGQTNKNLAKRWQGSGCDDALNANGKKQAKELAQKVKDFGLQKIYCSPLIRARQTAFEIVQCYKKLPVEIVSDLREGYFGVAEGITEDDVCRRFGKTGYIICHPTFDNWHTHFAGGESKYDIFCRVNACLQKIVQAPETTVGIVCHAGVISALQCGFQLKDVCFDNCAVLHLQYDEERGKFEKIS